MGEEKRVQEPAEDSLSDAVTAIQAAEHPLEGISIFDLSGGIIRPTVKTYNRIEGLLARMSSQPGSGRYIADIDRNLDYLFTSLQLDMINMAAESSAEEQEPQPSEDVSPEVKLELGPPIHDDSREG